MSRISEVLQNKNKIEKARKARRKNEMASLRKNTAFKAMLYEELRHLDVIFDSEEVEAVLINVQSKQLAQFSTAIYSEELVGYDIKQVENNPNQFFIRRKFITF